MNDYRKWFYWVTVIGVAINIFGMAIPFIFAPQLYLDHFVLPGGGGSVIWMRQAGLLLLFVSLLYVPGGYDPFRYCWNAWFAVVVRMTIGLYWLWLVVADGQTRSFIKFGVLDVTYAIFNGLLLWQVLKHRPTTSS